MAEFVVRDGEVINTDDYFSWDQDLSKQLQDELHVHAEGLFDTWKNLSLSKPPEDIFGKVVWTFGMMSQMVLSIFMFPASLGAFLMEETVQTAGMGAYILSSARYYDLLGDYLGNYQTVIEGAREATINLSLLSPVVGGAVLKYMDAATDSWGAFRAMTTRKLFEQLEKDEELRRKLMEEQIYGELRLSSSPSSAEIWIDGVYTELFTPETFKKMEVGAYIFELRKFNKRTEEWDIYVFTINIEAGRRKEVHARIPLSTVGEEEQPDQADGFDTDKLPMWIKAEVEGDYAVDGDTFRTKTGERIRILGIDAPETGRPWSEEADAYLDDLVHGKNISLRIQSRLPLDTHGRTLAICKMYKGDIAELMLVSGLARLNIFPEDIFDPTSYELAEKLAKERKIGIWSLY